MAGADFLRSSKDQKQMMYQFAERAKGLGARRQLPTLVDESDSDLIGSPCSSPSSPAAPPARVTKVTAPANSQHLNALRSELVRIFKSLHGPFPLCSLIVGGTKLIVRISRRRFQGRGLTHSTLDALQREGTQEEFSRFSRR